MAKARMLHKAISISKQVNMLSMKAQLLFTWMISHADDDGRLKGDAETVRATVIPMKTWSFSTVEKLLEEITDSGLINRWEVNSEKFIEFPSWRNYQQIKNDRYKPSALPPYHSKEKDTLDTDRNLLVSNLEPQYNVIESNKIKDNVEQTDPNNLAEESKEGTNKTSLIRNPKSFSPTSPGEFAALEAWKKLESSNPAAFGSTYLKALDKGLPPDLFFKFSSEISQDPKAKNRGAIFNSKVKQWVESHNN